MPRKNGKTRSRRNRSSGNEAAIRNSHSIMQADGQLIVPEDFVVPFRTPGLPLSVPKHIQNQTFWHREIVDNSGFTTSTTVETLGTIRFQLSDLGGLSGLTDVFDQYFLAMVEVQLIPTNNIAATNVGLLITAIDYDSQTAPASITALSQYSSARQTKGSVGQTRIVYPMINSPSQSTASAVLTGGVNTRSWIDCAYDTTAHFGLSYGINATSTVTTYQIRCRYWICFRASK